MPYQFFEAERPIVRVSEVATVTPDRIPHAWHELARALQDEHLTPTRPIPRLDPSVGARPELRAPGREP